MKSDASFGLLLMAIGVLTLCFVPQIANPQIGNNKDPGPRAFPAALALCLTVGGATSAIGALLKARRLKDEPAATRGNFPAYARALRSNPAVILLLALILYVIAIPWMGFSIATFLFAASMMLRLGARWWLALLVTIVMVVAIRLLFVSLFKVQLPEGILASCAAASCPKIQHG